MTILVKETACGYQSSKWPIDLESKDITRLMKIENQKMFFYEFQYTVDFNRMYRHAKLAKLRGSIEDLSEKEIDDQINQLRNEWDRNI